MRTRKSKRDRKIAVEATNKDLAGSKTTVICTESHSATVTHVSRSDEVAQHEYIDDSWQNCRKPKTDYTYSRSGSYSPTGLGAEYINPNMSRSKLKHFDIWLETTESTSKETLQTSSSAIEATGLHTPPHTPATYTVNRTESVSTYASLPRSCTRSGLHYSTVDHTTSTVRKNSLSPSRSWRGGGDSLSNSDTSSPSLSPTYKSSKNKSTISTQTKQLGTTRRSIVATNQSLNCQSAVISQSVSQTSTRLNYNVHTSSSSPASRQLSQSRSHSPDDTGLRNISTIADRSTSREMCQSNQSSNAVTRKRSVTNRVCATTDRTLNQSREVTDSRNVNQSASSSWLPNRSRSRSAYCVHGNNISHLYGLDCTDGEFSDHDECTMLYSRRGYPCTPYKTSSRGRRYVCPDDGPCGMCRIFRQLGCCLCSVINLVVQCLFGLVMLFWCAVGGVLHSFIADTVLRDVWLLSKTKRVRRKCNICYLLPIFIIVPLLLSGAYCVYRRGTGIDRFPLWSFFNLRVFRISEVNDQLDKMADKLQYPHDNSPHMMASPNRGEEHRSGWVQNGLGYLQNMWAWESQQPHIQQQQHERPVGIDRNEIEAIVRAAVQKQLSDLGVQAGVSGTGSSDARFAQAQLQQAAQITSLQGQIQAVDKMTQEVTAQLQSTKEHIDHDAEVVRTENLDNVRQLEQRQAELQAEAAQLKESQLALIEQLKKCCKNDAALKLLVRAGVQEQLAAVMLGEQGQGKVCVDENCPDKIDSPFAMWLQTQFMSRADMDSQIVQLAAKLNQQIKIHARAAAMDAVAAAGAAQAAAGHGSNMLGADDGLPTKDQVKALIQQALLVFDADKTGTADYALESSGGSIVSTRCSTTYHRRTAQLSLFGIPLWYASNSPRTVIQPGTHPGQCWAFRGAQGYLVIQLSGFVKISSVSLEHIPKSLSPTGKIDSAPKDFTVWGLQDENDRNGVLLGNYTYEEDKLPLQYFSLQNSKAGAFNFVELQVLSNHGNLEFTCLYRFRVHGHIYG